MKFSSSSNYFVNQNNTIEIWNYVKFKNKKDTWKFVSIDRLSASSIVIGEISPLKHEIRNNTMED